MFSKLFGSVSVIGPWFVVGNLDLISASRASSRFAVAGARRGLSSDSVAWLESQVDCLDPARHVLVSGLAVGSDTVAHRRALFNGVPQIAVLPSGFDRVYPKINLGLAHSIIDNGGCLVSLLPPHCSPYRESFIDRNAVIAELGHMLIVPQFEVRSGTRYTVDVARDLGRFIVVRDCTASGNQFIIGSSDYHTVVR